VAVVSQAIEKNVAGQKVSFFELAFLNKDMTILVPMNGLNSTGIRRLSSTQNVDDVLRMLTQPTSKDFQELVASNWNKRNKEYQCKLRTGSLYEIGYVYRDLKYIATKKELSFGEKNLLQQTEALLAQEISLVKKMNEDKAVEQLRSLFTVQQNKMLPTQVKQNTLGAL
jgi:CarD family transcriptional regulator